MCPLGSTNWFLISQKTTFFVVTAVKTSILHLYSLLESLTLDSPGPAQPEENPFGGSEPLQEQRSKEAPPTPGFGVLVIPHALSICRPIVVFRSRSQVMTWCLQWQKASRHLQCELKLPSQLHFTCLDDSQTHHLQKCLLNYYVSVVHSCSIVCEVQAL
jgi:hypothetical protein